MIIGWEESVNELRTRYQRIIEKKGSNPTWAYHKIKDSSQLVSPTIPFVGKKYFEQPYKVLVYASAENLNEYDGYLDDDELAINRHRTYFEDTKESRFFPIVHMAPMDGGALSTVVYFLMKELMNIEDMKPVELYEKICFANYGKYAAEFDEKGEKNSDNKDYAGNKCKLDESKEFIQVDMEVLKPDYIIMIKRMLEEGEQRSFLDSIRGEIKIIPIMQINAQNTNFHIKKYDQTGFENIDESVKQWFEMIDEERTGKGRIQGGTKQYFKSVFSYLEKVMKNDVIK